MSVGSTETIHARIVLTSTSTRLTRKPTLSLNIACCSSHSAVTANGTWFTGGRRVCSIARMSARATGAIVPGVLNNVEVHTMASTPAVARARRIGLVLFVAVGVYLVLNVTLGLGGGSPDVPYVAVMLPIRCLPLHPRLNPRSRHLHTVAYTVPCPPTFNGACGLEPRVHMAWDAG